MSVFSKRLLGPGLACPVTDLTVDIRVDTPQILRRVRFDSQGLSAEHLFLRHCVGDLRAERTERPGYPRCLALYRAGPRPVVRPGILGATAVDPGRRREAAGSGRPYRPGRGGCRLSPADRAAGGLHRHLARARAPHRRLPGGERATYALRRRGGRIGRRRQVDDGATHRPPAHPFPGHAPSGPGDHRRFPAAQPGP